MQGWSRTDSAAFRASKGIIRETITDFNLDGPRWVAGLGRES